MHKHPRLTEERIRRTRNRIAASVFKKIGDVEAAIWEAPGEPVPALEALVQEYKPCVQGRLWGSKWGTAWFRFRGTVPEVPGGREALARVGLRRILPGVSGEGFTVEGLVYRDGLPERAINVHRTEIPLPGRPGTPFEFFVEAAANVAPETFCGVVDLLLPEPGGQPQFELALAELSEKNPEAEALLFDFDVAAGLLEAMPVEDGVPRERSSYPATDLRRGMLLRALNDACNLFDESDPSTFVTARAAIAGVLSEKNPATTHMATAVGHAHIDTAWLWPLREAIRKCARTFSSQLRYMERYPEYVFVCSQAQQYAWMKALYPSIYEGIRDAVRRGQWEPVGSMWVEADCNLSGGESLVRQIVAGKRFFLDEFGCETRDVWLPDVFGYAASLPQIMKLAGIDAFITQKISWNQFNRFPHHTFLWRGIDGTGVFTHFPPADTYNARMEPLELAAHVRNFRDHDRASRGLYVYGYGDGGGGPTERMLEMARRMRDVHGLPRVESGTLTSFLDAAKAESKDLPEWVGELYLELHRGTLTTQAANKRGNRLGEFQLRDAEFFDAVAGPFDVPPAAEERAVYDVVRPGETSASAYLERAWKLLLLNQFHDIIPGSSIAWVYRDSAKDYATIGALAGAVRDAGIAVLAVRVNTGDAAEPVLAINTLSHPRREVVAMPDGRPAFVEVPACGYAVMDASARPPVGSFAMPVELEERERIVSLDNGMVRVLVDRRDGTLRSVRDHRAQREVLAPGTRGNVFQILQDIPNNWDAWDVDLFAFETAKEVGGLESVRVLETGPLRASVEIARAFGRSRIVQKITLRAACARVDFETWADWREDRKMLKVAFPVNILAPAATFEIQYGHIQRPTHQNTSWDMARFEVAAQKWADLSEGDYGVALLNDGKYGHDIRGNVMRLSLLRAPTAPDPGADRGEHRFSYALFPHVGGFRSGGVIAEAYAFNSPIRIVPIETGAGPLPAQKSWFEVDRPGTVIEAIKRADREEGVVVRLYEAHGTRGPAVLRSGVPFREAWVTDLLERPLAKAESDGDEILLRLKPFEIVTLLLKP